MIKHNKIHLLDYYLYVVDYLLYIIFADIIRYLLVVLFVSLLIRKLDNFVCFTDVSEIIIRYSASHNINNLSNYY